MILCDIWNKSDQKLTNKKIQLLTRISYLYSYSYLYLLYSYIYIYISLILINPKQNTSCCPLRYFSFHTYNPMSTTSTGIFRLDHPEILPHLRLAFSGRTIACNREERGGDRSCWLDRPCNLTPMTKPLPRLSYPRSTSPPAIPSLAPPSPPSFPWLKNQPIAFD